MKLRMYQNWTDKHNILLEGLTAHYPLLPSNLHPQHSQKEKNDFDLFLIFKEEK